MNKPQKAKVLLLTGPSGAGKTTVSKALLKELSGTWAYINHDEIRQLVNVGYESADDYAKNWSAETLRQWNVSIPICTDLINRYVEYEINCLVDCFAPPDEYARWQEQLEGIEYNLVVLHPNLQINLARNTQRPENNGRLKDNKVRQIHSLFEVPYLSQATIIDTSELNVSSVVQQIVNILS